MTLWELFSLFCMFQLTAQSSTTLVHGLRLLRGVVAPCGGVDDKVPQLHVTVIFISYISYVHRTITFNNVN